MSDRQLTEQDARAWMLGWCCAKAIWQPYCMQLHPTGFGFVCRWCGSGAVQFNRFADPHLMVLAKEGRLGEGNVLLAGEWQG